jgi:ComF family protein
MDFAGLVRSGTVQPLAALFDLVLPPRCAGCGVIVDGDGRFCGPCWQGLRFIAAPQCASCGEPFAYDRGADAQCGACLATPPAWDRARAALAYEGPARTALLRFKLADRQHLAGMMVPHMARAGAALLGPDALLVPVPLHRWRLWRRGFNQSALLARGLARAGLGQLAVDALVRVRATRPSVGLNPSERAANVKGAFRLASSARVQGRAVVLIDDVLTSGATASACALALHKAGAATVDVLTWARVVRDRI